MKTFQEWLDNKNDEPTSKGQDRKTVKCDLCGRRTDDEKDYYDYQDNEYHKLCPRCYEYAIDVERTLDRRPISKRMTKAERRNAKKFVDFKQFRKPTQGITAGMLLARNEDEPDYNYRNYLHPNANR